MKKVAAIYARVATREQLNDLSIEDQIEQLRTFINKKGYTDIEVFADEGYSGNNFNRPEFQRLIRNLERFEAIAVWKIDRLSRNNDEVLSLINNYLKPSNKKLLVSTCDIDSSTPNGYMFLSLLVTFSEYERKIRFESISNGMKRRARLGKWSGRVMIGYDLNNDELTINKRESRIVKEIFELRSEMRSYKSIADHINAKGYRTKRGNRFNISSVKTILENPIYAGFIKYRVRNDHPVKSNQYRLVRSQHPVIIDHKLWERVQTIKLEQKHISSGS
ncbi:recombinase family protein [Niallia circulans]|uniref:recombinase family protein n=1 Tax=Niallia circulans TaxID=1397 RepID=UPI00148FCE7D|nr:recombinase family protein [Niallia circulans]QJX64589.1 recombinase family protein [Niallia circulans]